MVPRAARRPARRTRVSGVARFIEWWRAALSAAVLGVAREARAAGTHVASRLPRDTLLDVRRWPIVLAGIGAVCVGAGCGIALAVPGPPRAAAMLAGATGVVWAAARWLIAHLAARHFGIDDSPALRGALAAGMVAYAFALTPELRVAAWIASGAITALVLIRLKVATRTAWRLVALAWGAQGVSVAGAWLARNAYIIATGFGR